MFCIRSDAQDGFLSQLKHIDRKFNIIPLSRVKPTFFTKKKIVWETCTPFFWLKTHHKRCLINQKLPFKMELFDHISDYISEPLWQYYVTFLTQVERERLLVTGGKGSGKTMLLIFLVKMVTQWLREEDSGKSSVLVKTRTLKSIGLSQIFKSELSNASVKGMSKIFGTFCFIQNSKFIARSSTKRLNEVILSLRFIYKAKYAKNIKLIGVSNSIMIKTII